jgi:circadian clock protein KaiC
MAHSNQVREFVMSRDGIKLREPYIGPEGVLTGSARLAQEAKEKADRLVREQEMQRRARVFERKKRELTAQIEVLQAQLDSDEAEMVHLNREGADRETRLVDDRTTMATSRHSAASKPASKPMK